MKNYKYFIVPIILGFILGFLMRLVLRFKEVITINKSPMVELVEVESDALRHFSKESIYGIYAFRNSNGLTSPNSPYSPDYLILDLLLLNRLGVIDDESSIYRALVENKKYLPYRDLLNNRDTFAIGTIHDRESAIIGINYLDYACRIKDKYEMNYDELQNLRPNLLCLFLLYNEGIFVKENKQRADSIDTELWLVDELI